MASPGTPGAHDAAIDDLNGDSYPDIFLLYHRSPSKVLFYDGSGGFRDSGQNIGGASDDPQWVILADPDFDGDLDIISSYINEDNCLLINEGPGSFTNFGPIFGSAWAHAFTTGKLDEDASIDIIIGYDSAGGGLTLFFSQ